jgi:two-component system phosphate regulon response regulator PhoB
MKNRIHIVEDDEDIRYVVCYILKEMGYQIKISDTIADFKKQTEVYEPELILLDVMLPDGNGLELCTELKKSPSTKNIPVIIMSAHATKNEVFKQTCAEDFIAKPFDLDDLSSLVKKYLPA